MCYNNDSFLIVHASSSTVEFEGTDWIIVNNTADFGAGIALTGLGDRLYFHANTHLCFEYNVAHSQGGALYVTENPFSYCEFEDGEQFKDACFLQYFEGNCQPELHSNAYETDFAGIHLDFVNNLAGEIGNVLHGGSLYSCYYCDEGDLFIDGFKAFGFLANVSGTASSNLDLSSDPFSVHTCESYQQNTTRSSLQLEVYPKQTIAVSVVAVGQMNKKSPAVIRAIASEEVTIDDSQILQSITKECSEVQYTVLSVDLNNGSLKLYADEPCSTSGFPLTSLVKFLPCPSGFFLDNGECQCDPRLQGFEVECDIQDQNLLHSGDFWIGLTDKHVINSDISKLVLHPHCPFDYCREEKVRLSMNNSDLQCANGRSGTLSGTCQSGLSLSLGSSQCLSCSNVFLVLLIPFALAGVVLVVLLFTLQLTVSTGTISGLVFYANILAVKKRIFFPPGETNTLTVFIAWLNLDLGIETCFVYTVKNELL